MTKDMQRHTCSPETAKADQVGKPHHHTFISGHLTVSVIWKSAEEILHSIIQLFGMN